MSQNMYVSFHDSLPSPPQSSWSQDSLRPDDPRAVLQEPTSPWLSPPGLHFHPRIRAPFVIPTMPMFLPADPFQSNFSFPPPFIPTASTASDYWMTGPSIPRMPVYAPSRFPLVQGQSPLVLPPSAMFIPPDISNYQPWHAWSSTQPHQTQVGQSDENQPVQETESIGEGHNLETDYTNRFAETVSLTDYTDVKAQTQQGGEHQHQQQGLLQKPTDRTHFSELPHRPVVDQDSGTVGERKQTNTLEEQTMNHTVTEEEEAENTEDQTVIQQGETKVHKLGTELRGEQTAFRSGNYKEVVDTGEKTVNKQKQQPSNVRQRHQNGAHKETGSGSLQSRQQNWKTGHQENIRPSTNYQRGFQNQLHHRHTADERRNNSQGYYMQKSQQQNHQWKLRSYQQPVQNCQERIPLPMPPLSWTVGSSGYPDVLSFSKSGHTAQLSKDKNGIRTGHDARGFGRDVRSGNYNGGTRVTDESDRSGLREGQRYFKNRQYSRKSSGSREIQ